MLFKWIGSILPGMFSMMAMVFKPMVGPNRTISACLMSDHIKIGDDVNRVLYAYLSKHAPRK